MNLEEYYSEDDVSDLFSLLIPKTMIRGATSILLYDVIFDDKTYVDFQYYFEKTFEVYIQYILAWVLSSVWNSFFLHLF